MDHVSLGSPPLPPHLSRVEISSARLEGSKSNVSSRTGQRSNVFRGGEGVAGLVRKAHSQQLQITGAQLCAEMVRLHAEV